MREIIERLYDDRGTLLRELPWMGPRIDRINSCFYCDGAEYRVVRCEVHATEGIIVTVGRRVKAANS